MASENLESEATAACGGVKGAEQVAATLYNETASFSVILLKGCGLLFYAIYDYTVFKVKWDDMGIVPYHF